MINPRRLDGSLVGQASERTRCVNEISFTRDTPYRRSSSLGVRSPVAQGHKVGPPLHPHLHAFNLGKGERRATGAEDKEREREREAKKGKKDDVEEEGKGETRTRKRWQKERRGREEVH